MLPSSLKRVGRLVRGALASPDYADGRTPLYWRLNQGNPIDYYLDVRERADWPGRLGADGLPDASSLSDDPTYRHAILRGWWALGQLQRHNISGEEGEKRAFLRYADALRDSGEQSGTARLWRCGQDARHYGVAPGHVSAHEQGLAASILSRAFAVTQDEGYAEAARAAVAGLLLPVEDGGCSIDLDGHRFLVSYGTEGAPRMEFRGWVLGLLGIRDSWLLTGEEAAEGPWNEGVAAVRAVGPRWSAERWSNEVLDKGTGKPLLSSLAIHDLHVQLLRVMYRLSKDAFFDHWKEDWEDRATSPRSRLRAAILRPEAGRTA